MGGGGSGDDGGSAATFDRRCFLRRSGQAGVVAGVLGWSAPQVRSVEPGADAGTPQPEETTTTPTVQGGAIIPPGGTSTRDAVLPGVQEAPSTSGGGFALTGAELGQMAAMGSVALGIGEVVRRKGARKRREVEAEAEANAERARAAARTEPGTEPGTEPAGPA